MAAIIHNDREQYLLFTLSHSCCYFLNEIKTFNLMHIIHFLKNFIKYFFAYKNLFKSCLFALLLDIFGCILK
jgi:hypothetical protein